MFLSNAKGWDNMVNKRQMVIEVEAKSVCETVHIKLSEGGFIKILSFHIQLVPQLKFMQSYYLKNEKINSKFI